MKKYRAVVSDLDGTLLGLNHMPSKYTKKIVNKVIKKGIKFYIATGRNYNQTKIILDELEIKIPLITSNGAMVYDENGKLIKEETINQKDVETILSIDYKKYGTNIIQNFYCGNDWYTIKGEREQILSSIDFDFIVLPKEITNKKVLNKKVHKIFYFGEPQELKKLEEELLSKMSEDVALIYVLDHCIEIFSKKANKAIAAKFLLEKENISIDEVVSFGDGENDFELLTEVGQGYMMGNAIERLKNLLPNDFPSVDKNSEDGEAKKLVELFLSK